MVRKFPLQVIDIAAYSNSVKRAVSSENLGSVASKTSDSQVLLGLACLGRTGHSIRQEISEMARRANPEFAPIVAVLSIVLDHIDGESIAELIRRAPENALGHYLRAKLAYDSNKAVEALEAFRTAARFFELRLYESTTGAALFKALDALNLTGRDRLCALSWMATRSSNFSACGLQFLRDALSELAHADANRREEISEILLVLAGHLFATNFQNRWYTQRALEAAFHLKAEIAATAKSPKMHGYAAAVQALFNLLGKWPGIE